MTIASNSLRSSTDASFAESSSSARASSARSLVESGPLSLAEQADALAAGYYEQGFHCGESVVRAVNEIAEHPLPPEAMRMASGFCEGLGGSRCMCGALAGGVMSAGLLAGREDASDAWEPSYDAAAELRRRWVADQDAQTCDEVVSRIGGMHLPQRWTHCTVLVGSTARWVVQIAEERGWL